MKYFSFTKMSGAGNDFVLFDTKINPDLQLSTENIQKICERRTGIGADGVLVISDTESFSFDMQYFNADGSTGSLCANGARCALKYADESGRLKDDCVEFSANGLSYSGRILDDGNVKFFLNSPRKLKYNFKIKVAGQLITASFADTGSPQVVIKITDVLKNSSKPSSFYNNIDEFPVFEIGKEIRYSKNFAPDGTNVNFIYIHNGIIKIRSYERGVENETLSCGTGAVASGIICSMYDQLMPPIKIIPKSGDILFVDFKIDGLNLKDISLTGPAEIIFKGELSI